MRRVRHALVLGAALAWLVASAGDEVGRIEGRVTRSDGTPLPQTEVTVAGTSLSTTTDKNGNFTLRRVPVGTYDLTFVFGTHSATSLDVSVTPEATTRVEQVVDWDIGVLETVTVQAVSRYRERLVEAPAPVTTVSEAQIERQAPQSQLFKLVEFTPGVEVSQGGLYHFDVTTRGFNNFLNRRLAVLIDGRDVSDPFIGTQDYRSFAPGLEDLAGVELVRGPAAALYGANSTAGVMELTTKAPRYSQGGLVRLTAGQLETVNVDFRWAGGLGRDWYLSAVGAVRRSEDFAVSRVGTAEYSVPCPADQPSATDCLPQETVYVSPIPREIGTGTVRLDKYVGQNGLLTFEGGRTDHQGLVNLASGGRGQAFDVDYTWGRFNYSDKHWTVLAYVNDRDIPDFVNLGPGSTFVLDTERAQAEAQTQWGFVDDTVRLVAGGLYKRENIDTLDPATGKQTAIFGPVHADFRALFAQADWSIGSKVKLVGALRWDNSTLWDSQLSPKAALILGINDRNTLRFTYNEAFLAPTYVQYFLSFFLGTVDLSDLEATLCEPEGVSCGLGETPLVGVGNVDLDVEKVRSLEFGYSGLLWNRAFVTLNLYRTENRDFVSNFAPQITPMGRTNPNFGLWEGPPEAESTEVAPGVSVADTVRDAAASRFASGGGELSNAPDGEDIVVSLTFTNVGQVDTRGADLGFTYFLGRPWKFLLNYSWFDFEIQDPTPGTETFLLPNSPENMVSAGASYLRDRWNVNLRGRWYDEFRWADGIFQGDVEAFAVVDVFGSYRLNDNWLVGAHVANLTDNEHWESFGGDLIGQRALAYLTFSW